MEHFVETYIEHYRELHQRLRDALMGLDQRQLDWSPAGEANSIDVLLTHTLASERDWLHVAAGRPNERDREAEFRVAGRSADHLLEQLDATAVALPELVHVAVSSGFDTPRQRPRGSGQVSVLWCLLHSIEHTCEHIAHIELTRQLLR